MQPRQETNTFRSIGASWPPERWTSHPFRRPDDGGGLDEVELGPALVEVWLALLLDLILVRSPTRGRTFAVLIIEHVDDFYPVGNQAEWCEPIVIQSLVVPEVDEHLCGARVRPSRSKRHIATGITLRNGVVLNVGILPNLIDSGIGADAELRHEARKDAEEAGVVVEVVFDQIVEAVRAERCPRTRDGDDEVAARGRELHLVFVGR